MVGEYASGLVRQCSHLSHVWESDLAALYSSHLTKFYAMVWRHCQFVSAAFTYAYWLHDPSSKACTSKAWPPKSTLSMVWSSFLRSHRGTNVLSVVRPASDHNTAQFLLHPPHTGAATSQRQVASHVRRYQTKFVSSTGTSEVKVVAWWTATRSSNIASPPHSANRHLLFFFSFFQKEHQKKSYSTSSRNGNPASSSSSRRDRRLVACAPNLLICFVSI